MPKMFYPQNPPFPISKRTTEGKRKHTQGKRRGLLGIIKENGKNNNLVMHHE